MRTQKSKNEMHEREYQIRNGKENEREKGSPKFNGRTAEIFRERKREEERCLILLLLFYNKKFGKFFIDQNRRIRVQPEVLFYNLQLRTLSPTIVAPFFFL